MVTKVCVVGAGECFTNYYSDALDALKRDGVTELTTFVDVKPQNNFGSLARQTQVSYLQRERGQSLPDLLEGADVDVVERPVAVVVDK